MQLSSFAQVDLGLSKDEFYDLTPREFDGLCRRHTRLVEDKEFMFAQLTAYVINFSHWRSQPKHPVHPKDLMPSQIRRSREVESVRPKRLNRRKVEEKVRATFGALFGDGK